MENFLYCKIVRKIKEFLDKLKKANWVVTL